jgi:hypothetical protein
MGKLALQKNVALCFQFQSATARDLWAERPAPVNETFMVLFHFLFAPSSLLKELAELALKTIGDDGD